MTTPGKSWRIWVSELYRHAVGWRVRGRPRQWVWSVFRRWDWRFAWRAAMRRATVASGGGYTHAGCRRRRRPGRGGPGPPAGRSARAASTGLMPEQKLGVPACPRRGSGHLWRFDRERSTPGSPGGRVPGGLVRLTVVPDGGKWCATWERITATHDDQLDHQMLRAVVLAPVSSPRA